MSIWARNGCWPRRKISAGSPWRSRASWERRPSTIWKNAIGQYILYHDVLARLDPDRELYLAITEETFEEVFADPLGALLLQNGRMRLLIFDALQEVIRRWIPAPPTVR